MTSIDRQEADRLLTWLLDLPAGERTAALESVCGDAALRRTVLRLVRAAEEPGGSVDPGSERSRRLWTDFASRVAERETPLAAGAVLGPYRILSEIDRGGMAVVYRAERVDGEFTREVAVKVLKLGFDSEEVVRRFEQERQILADLDHPNIGRMFDGGRTDEGRPYVVMELVEGQPLDRYCDARRLTVEERLELFCVVAGAVEYAHQKLVVHRDLKPSNILVTESGQVKLLDFGIARLVDVEVGDGAAASSRTRLHMMTPEYASPEQLRGERVTTASDVYQLGLLLYRLLTGRRPYVLSDPGAEALARAICEQEPPRPSTAFLRDPKLERPTPVSAGMEGEEAAEPTVRARPSGADGATPEVVAHARRTTPSRLRRRLRGDLDGIVLQALRKEPAERYPSAEQLARDIRRHRAKLPVTARADTSIYRARKFLARHAIGATATALALIAAAGVAGFHTARIRAERDRAQAEATKAGQMNEFLTGLFRGADPREARGADISARELLDRGVEQVDRDLTAQPEIQADMLQILGRTYLEMGVYDAAERLLNRALELRRRHLGPRHPEVAEVLGDLGLLQYQRGEYILSRTQLEEAVDILESAPAGETTELTTELNALGQTLGKLGEYESARAVFERALAIELRLSGEDSNETAGILHSLAIVTKQMGDLEDAEALYERVLATFERSRGPDHPWVGATLMNLANLRIDRGALEGVEAMYRRSLHIAEKAYGLEHDQTGVALINLGNFLNIVGRYEEAVDVLRRSTDILEQAVGAGSPLVGYALVTLGDAQRGAGRLREAKQSYQRSLAVLEDAVEGRKLDVGVVSSLVGLGRVETGLGNRTVASELLNRAATMWREAARDVDPQLTPALLDVVRWLIEERRCPEAQPLLRRVHPAQTSRHPRWSAQAAELEASLAECVLPGPVLETPVAATSSP